MATVIHHVHDLDHGSIAQRARGLVERAVAYIAARHERAMVMRDLQACEERDLRDLGINVCDFDAIANGTYKREAGGWKEACETSSAWSNFPSPRMT